MRNLQKLKQEYNYNLNRYYNGCNYLSEHTDEVDKYVNEIIKIKDHMDNVLNEILENTQVTENEILGGFKL